MSNKTDIVINVEEEEEVVDLDSALENDPEHFGRLLDAAVVVTNGREADSADLEVTIDFTALCKAVELRRGESSSEASFFGKIAERGPEELLLHPLLQTFMLWKHNLLNVVLRVYAVVRNSSASAQYQRYLGTGTAPSGLWLG